jgi:hypothetical protein
MTWYQEWFGEEYLELYSHRDENEARQQVAFFRDQLGMIRGPLLDLACGMGRHMQELRSEGYHPIGCDLSYILLQAGIREYGLLPVARADMRQLPFCDNVFAGLVNFFTSFGYFATEEENMQLVERETRQGPTGTVEIERWFDGSDRSFNKRITIGQKRYLERVRGYDLDEISAMFTSCNLSIQSAFGDFDGSKFDHASPRLILVGSRIR